MNPLGCLVCVLLPLIVAQQLCVFLLLHGQFIHSPEAIGIYFNFDLRGQDGGMTYRDYALPGADAVVLNIVNASTIVVVSLFTPLVLVPFAFLALLFGVVYEERGVLVFSLLCQMAASSLTLLGLGVFTVVHWASMSLESVTVGFYLSVGVGVQLALSAGMTWRLGMTGDRMVFFKKCERLNNIDCII